MINKKHIFITALVTFVVTAFLVFYAVGGGFFAMIWSSMNNGTNKIKKVEALIDNYFIYDYCDNKLTSYKEEELRFNLKTLVNDIMQDMIKFELDLYLDDSRVKELKYKKDKELKEKGKIINKYATLSRLERDMQPSYYDYAVAEIMRDICI